MKLDDNVFYGKQVMNRIKEIPLKVCSVSFLSWALLLFLWTKGFIKFDGTEFLVFTAAVIGIKAYKAIKENGK